MENQEHIPHGQPVTVKVGKALRERRIDKYLHGRFANVSRRFMQEAIKGGHVKVDGKTVKPSYKLNEGETIDLILPEPPSKDILPEDIPLEILYEDEDLIVINKQAGIIVHPARGNTHGTLVNALAHYADSLSSGLGECRPGIVHRLDRNTTGVMVVTKNEIAQSRVAKQFEQRKVKKEYLAIIHGSPQLDADRVNAPLGIHPRVREKYAVRPESGKEAVTDFEVLERFRGYALIKCKPKTGRTHQIRVHLAHISHPIVADDMYGGKIVYPWQLADEEPTVQSPLLARCALHAWKLAFTHPKTEAEMELEAPMPEDMQILVNAMREHRAVE